MRMTIPQPQLLKTLQTVERAVNDRSTLPILANILLETTEQELVLTATDLDVGIRCRFPLAPPVEQGAVTLPARKLTTVVRELPGEPVVLEAKKNHTATLQCGASHFRIPGLPAEDFPTLPPPQQEEGLSVSQAALKTMIDQTAHAMSMEETRFILNGALLTAQKGDLIMVATDGRRLAVARAPVDRAAKGAFQAVIPSKTVRELGRLLQGDDVDEVVIAPLKENQVTFQFGPVTVISRLIEGQFPPYEKVIPPPSKTTFSSSRQALIDAVRRASLMTTATSQAVLFELGPSRLVVSKESPELGSAREELPVTYDGEPVTIAFNPEFWLDALKTMETEEVTIEVSGPDRPAVIRQPAFTYLVLPMKVA
ncbi:MAG: DNA polymerase III subunit beta [Candidatus Omnitrophica bacterium]|nr:DNA polymerase III subunit beta [Candidatus Omnitrophota bacterium]